MLPLITLEHHYLSKVAAERLEAQYAGFAPQIKD